MMLKNEAIEAIINRKILFDDLSDELRGDKDVVVAAVKQDGLMLEFASDKLKSDKEVVMAAVKENGDALEFAGEELRADSYVVMESVKDWGNAIRYAGVKLRGDKKIVMKAVKNSNGWAYRFLVEKMQRDSDVILLTNKKLRQFKQSVDDHLCSELVKLKKKYKVDTLEVALEMEALEMENGRLLSYVIKKCESTSVVKRL